MTLEQQFHQAVEYHRQGRLSEAESLYRAVLASIPDHFDSLHMLGVIYLAKGEPQLALELIEYALSFNPNVAVAYFNRGVALQTLKRVDDALRNYEYALTLKPDYPDALANRGVVLSALGRLDDALASFDQALTLAPQQAAIWHNRANTMLALGRLKDALASYDHAIAINAHYVEAYNNRGFVLQQLQRPEEALGNYDLASEINPSHAEAHNNRGNVLRGLRRLEEALASFERALDINPNHTEALSNYGITLQDLKRPEEALLFFNRALQIKPDYAEALNNRGNVVRQLRRNDEALADYSNAIEIKPDYADALANRADLFGEMLQYDRSIPDLEKILHSDPDYKYAKGRLLHMRMHCCDWKDFDSLVSTIETDVRAGKRVSQPFSFQATSSSPAEIKACAEIFTADTYPVAKIKLWNGEGYAHDKIRLGYVSGEFREQATAVLAAGLFELHDRERFEIYAFDNGFDDGSIMRKRLENAFDNFVDVSRRSDYEAAKLIREREIDILVNLNGYFGFERGGVFAVRAAPIQISYLGFPGTLSADYMDYLIADRIVIPRGEEQHYNEKIVCLPDTYQVNDSKRRIAEHAPTRAEFGLPERAFVFCSFNNSYKYTPAIFDVWMRLLGKVEGSVLWLLQSNTAIIGNLRREAEARGISGERLVFAPFAKLDQHLARHACADLFLDSLPCNAHTTASDALWAGLPLITCAGSTFAGRVAASLLHAVGLPELITHSLHDYESLALKLAATPDMLSGIKAKLALNRLTHPLFNTRRFCRHIEAAYITMYERHQRGEGPAAFNVAPIPNA